MSLYLVKVQSTYHYRRYVPEDVRAVVGKRHWKHSLKTGELRIAECLLGCTLGCLLFIASTAIEAADLYRSPART